MLHFKLADEDWEFEAIHRLNYDTFVEEIPQHGRNAERRLVDRFHAENTYAICLDEERLVGMVCGRMKRPFSLDGKVPELDRYLPPGRSPFEIRLLAVHRHYRAGRVFVGLAAHLWQHFRDRGCDLALISGTTRQQRLYRHLGFVPFYGLVGDPRARFQPMYLRLEDFISASQAIARRASEDAPKANFLCGPVELAPAVREAFAQPPMSHRCARFGADYRATKRLLCRLTGAADVVILLGSGTLANDAIAAQLTTAGPGVVLSNGEFGDRLIDHAGRHGLEFEVVRQSWGEPFDMAALPSRLPGKRWLWAVHCETSTGVLNDLGVLKAACQKAAVALCLDCISSVGTMAVDLHGVHLASCVSGKGLGSYPGLSMVFYDSLPRRGGERLPRYLDLGYYAEQAACAFTTSTNLVYALQAALASTPWREKYARTAEAARGVRQRLRKLGFHVVGNEHHAAPGVLTIALPADVRSADLGLRLRQAGFLIGYESTYLVARNWIQLALMGAWSQHGLDALLEALLRARARDERVHCFGP